MKVLLINGSPHEKGCIHTALTLAAEVLNKEGIETEEIHVGNKDIRGCIACRRCHETGKCVFNDLVNETAPKLAEADGIPTEIVNGVPSFCCAAAACGTVLAEGQEDIHILSGFSPDKLALPGTKIIMKSGRKAAELKKDLLDLEGRAGSKVFAASDAGMPGQRVFRGASEFPEEGRYMTTVIVKER